MSSILEKTRSAMSERGIDVLVASSPENVAYIGGVSPPSQRVVRSRHAFSIIPIEGPTHYVVVGLEAGVVRERARADKIRVYQEFAENPISVAAEIISDLDAGSGRIGAETTHLPAADLHELQTTLPRAGFESFDEKLRELRLIKTSEEIETIRKIGSTAENVALRAIAEASSGATERDIGNRITELYADGGGDQLTMLVVGAGERSAEVNAPPTNREIESGNLVRVDVIGTMDDYYSDVARTAVAGSLTEEQTRIWSLLREVRERALEMMKPGVLTSDIYRIYEETMNRAGLPKYHFLGHGLGVTLHEEPFFSAFHQLPLEENMVMCVEPLCLLEGRFGMQLEDEVLITSDGCEPLTSGGPILELGG